jgi:hypothetical protein
VKILRFLDPALQIPENEDFSQYDKLDIARFALDGAIVIGVQTLLQPRDLLRENENILIGFLTQIFNAKKNLQYPSTALKTGKEILVLAADITESEEDLLSKDKWN